MRSSLPLLVGLALGVSASRLHSCAAALRSSARHEQRPCVWKLLRGGADELDSELEAEDEASLDGVDGEPSTASEANPFLDGAGGGGAMGLGLQDLASTLQDPKVLQDALRELQDPATQARVKAMMEDPAFQESMKQYMEQMMKDPQFEKLKEQAEQMMQQEGFMEQMSQAFADLGGVLGDSSKPDKSD
mmetsp:Transcript_2972/g.7416  ORF Transcript_2972/g.7416 Transcript_2972/m.7416 type:complete len:189 (+) Transcript_2972:25-591(+)